MSRKLTYKEIKLFIEGFEGNECKLLTTKEEYEINKMNTHSKLKIKCKCGKTFPKSFNKFKDQNQRQCKECGKNKISEANKGEKHPMYGKHHTEESKKKMSEANKGKNNPFYGKHHTEETRNKISDAHKGKKPSEETRKKMSEVHKVEKLSEETRKKLSEARKGKKHSKETRKKLSEAHKGKKKFWLERWNISN